MSRGGPEFDAGALDEEIVAAIPITAWVVIYAMFAGALGMLVMVPILLLVPRVLGVFQAAPILNFAEIGLLIGLEPSLWLGVVLFAMAGVVLIPLLFVVGGAFLPPREPRRLRGVTFATILWTGFIIAFWPNGPLPTIALFLVLSLLGHWAYGYVLGTVLHRFAEIPQHEV